MTEQILMIAVGDPKILGISEQMLKGVGDPFMHVSEGATS
jgi:hypothetical protein